jgi:hypothetical protein
VKNIAKGNIVIKDNKDQTNDFVDEFFEGEIKISIIYQANEDVDYEYWSSKNNSQAIISISYTLHNKCMNLLFYLKNTTSVFKIVVRMRILVH